MTDDKELEIAEGTPIVNAWDEEGGQSNNKVLVKTLPNQPASVESKPVAEAQEPFTAPSIDFTVVMPKIDPNTTVEPITVNDAEPIKDYSVELPKNDIAIPVFEMPEEIVKPIEEVASVEPIAAPIENVAPVQPIVEPIATPIETVVPVQPVVEPIATPIENVAPVQPIVEPIATPIENVAPVQQVVEPIATSTENVASVQQIVEPIATSTENVAPVQQVVEPNPQQAIINQTKGIQDIPNIISQEPVLDEQKTKEVQTMSSEEINKNFSNVINNNEPVNNETGINNTNTFTNLFDPNAIAKEKEIAPEIADKVFNAKTERVDIGLVSAVQKNKQPKKHLIPVSYRLGIILFLIMFIYILNIDKITSFIDSFVFNIG